MVKIILYLLVFLFCEQILSQTKQKISPPTEEMQLKAMIYSIEQSIRQHRSEPLDLLMDHVLSDGLEENIHREQIKIRIEDFFSNTEMRKENSLWSRLSSKEMTANWDFYVTSPPEITIRDTLAQADFQIAWLLHIPLIEESNKLEIISPTDKKDETVYFRKVGNRWKITGFETLLKIMKYCNSNEVKHK